MKKKKTNEEPKPISLKDFISIKCSRLNNDHNVTSSFFSSEADLLRKYVRQVKQGLFDISNQIYNSLSENTPVQKHYEEIILFLDSLESEIQKNTRSLGEYNSKITYSYEKVYMLTSNKEFLYNTYNKINTLINDFRMKSLLFVDSVYAKSSAKPLIELTNLPNILVENLKYNKSCYPLIYYTENYVRLYISIKYNEEFGDYTLKEYLNKCSKAKKTYETNKNDEEKYSWIKERGCFPAFYLDFIDLKNIILSNWESFKNDFPDQAFVTYNFDEFYKIRCKVAHNSYTIEYTEFDIISRNSYKITNQLKKYVDEIKLLEI
ncbi:MAG: hypothetical protein E7351_03810 [Clostridiales bacterium]|nr:hypothetical protein [Clostridiales bacterium]